METALATLQAQGSAGLSLREVARRLEVALPTLQRHFPTKDDLWRACIDEATREELGAALLEVTPDPSDEAPLLTAHVRALVGRSRRLPGLTAAILNDTSPGAGARLDYLEARARPVLARGRERIEQAVAEGRSRPVDVDVALALFAVGLTSLASSRAGLRRLFGIDLDDPAGAERFVAGLVDLLGHGLGPSRPPPRWAPADVPRGSPHR